MPGYHAIYPTVVPEEKEVFFDMERHDLSQSTFERKVVSENMPEHRRAALDPETLQVREVPMAARPLRNPPVPMISETLSSRELGENGTAFRRSLRVT